MSEAFLKVVNMSISAGWLVLAVLALRLILKKAPKWVNVLLWGIVAIRLICPFSIESALSLIPSTEIISPEIMMDWTPEISTGIEPLDQVVNPVISTSFAPQGMASANPLQILIPVAANLWLLGVLILLAYTAISYLTLRYKLRTAVILRDNVFQCETVSSPFVLGILKPRIYLPYAMDGKNLIHVVAHEKAHIRRKDHWWKPLGFLLLTVYWFNPLMWVAYILLCRDIELACDEKVIAELENDQRADYTQALVTCAVNRRMIAACPLAFGEVGVKDRVKSIMNYRKPTFWIIVTALVVCVAVAVCFLTDPLPEPSTEEWFDFTVDPEQLKWTDEVKCTRAEFPGITFKYTGGDIVATTSWEDSDTAEKTFLISGMPIWNAYFCDLTGDGKPEICSQVSYGSGIIDNRVIIFDYANGVSYKLEDRGYHDYYLRMEGAYLHVDKKSYNSDDLVSSGRLVFKDGCIQIEGVENKPEDITMNHNYFKWDLFENKNEDIVGIISSFQNMEPAMTQNGDILIIQNEGGLWHFVEGQQVDVSIMFENDGSYLSMKSMGYIYCGDSEDGLYSNEIFADQNTDMSSGRFTAPETGNYLFYFRNYSTSWIKLNDVLIEYGSQFQAKLLEIYDGYFIVEPVEGSWELRSASKIEVPMKNMEPSPEPQVGDILEIVYDGQLQETYPARITAVYGIRVISERPYVTEALTLNEVAELVKQQHTVSFVGMTREAVHGYWGKPDYEAFGFFGDIYHVPDTFESVVFRYDESETVTGVEIECRNEVPGDALFIVEIRDREKEEHLNCAEAEELFFEDDEYEYYFNVIKSHYVIVTYNNANSEDIITALNSGRATIADLDEFDIEYTKKAKS